MIASVARDAVEADVTMELSGRTPDQGARGIDGVVRAAAAAARHPVLTTTAVATLMVGYIWLRNLGERPDAALEVAVIAGPLWFAAGLAALLPPRRPEDLPIPARTALASLLAFGLLVGLLAASIDTSGFGVLGIWGDPLGVFIISIFVRALLRRGHQ